MGLPLVEAYADAGLEVIATAGLVSVTSIRRLTGIRPSPRRRLRRSVPDAPGGSARSVRGLASQCCVFRVHFETAA
jgi:hypothetical protein